MSDKVWKQFERRIAKRLGGRRVGILGKEDIEHPVFSVETKVLKELPKFMTKVYGQAKRNSPKGKIPFACIKENGRHDENALVILSFGDFQEILRRGVNE